jgi:predicted HicB family RNase H-like nuclease
MWIAARRASSHIDVRQNTIVVQNGACNSPVRQTLAMAVGEGEPSGMPENSKTATFPLRLPKSTRLQAVELAKREGLSLNQFIALAVVEKITRFETASISEQLP